MALLPFLAHLDDLRRSLVEGAPALPEMRLRLLLDTIRLGNRQTFDFLVQTRPSQSEFEAWILATAGPPDAELISRFNAWAGAGEVSAAAIAGLAAIEAMPDVLDADQMDHWDREGYVVVPDALTGDHCARLADALWTELGARPDDPASWYRQATDGIMVSVYQHPAQIEARRSARVLKAFAQLWGTANLWAATDRLGFNPPECAGHTFMGSPLHWDVSLARPIPFATQGVVYLTDTAEDQGAFRCVPGFHHRIDAWLDEMAGRNPRDVDLSDQAVCVPGRAGDLVIWRQDLPHGASPNRADTPRLVQYLNCYSPDMAIHDDWK